MGSVGVTAAELFFYPYLLKEKGYGERVGTRPADGTETWELRQKGWMNVLKTDVLICTVIATVITVALYLLAASVFHYGLGSVPIAQHGRNDNQSLINKTVFKVKG